MHKYFIAVIWAGALLAGCSNQAPLDVTTEQPKQTVRHTYVGKAAYNRPYTIKGKTYYPLIDAAGYRERGIASWYGAESGSRTATGSRFRPNGLSAAHKTLPLPCKAKVTNLRNRRSVIVVVNDRGPFAKNRLIDLSRGAAKAIGMRGQTEVEIEYLQNAVLSE